MIAARQRMSSVDTAWLRMERRTNPMVIVSVILLGERCSLAELRRLVADRFLAHARFRTVPVDEGVGGTWVEDPYFDLEAHVGEAAAATDSQADLERLVGELASSALDPRRPLWRFDLVRRHGAGSAIVLRIHHCYADGIALVKLFLGLTSRTPHEVAPATVPAPEDVHAEDDALLPWLRSLVAPAAALVGEAMSGGEALVEAGMRGLLHPLDALGSAQKAAGFAGDMAGELASLMRLPDDPPTALRGTLGTRKHVAWAAPLALGEVRTIARALDCTINDVVMSVVAGTLGRYLRELGADTAGLTVRAAVPVNLRPADEAPSLGNRFGLAFLELPVGLVHPLERLYAVHDAMRELKDSQQPAAAFLVLSALGYLPAPLESLAVDTLSRKASVVVSNVPGPRERLYLCGKPIDQMYFWVPQSGSIGLGISVLSYLDQVLFGLVADRTLIPEPHRIVDAFGAEFERLLLLTVLGAAHVDERHRPGGPRDAGTG